MNVLPRPSALDLDRAPVGLGDREGRRQAEPDPLVRAVPVVAADEEALEQARLVRLRRSRARRR